MNAKEEFKSFVIDRTVKCAILDFTNLYSFNTTESTTKRCILKLNYTIKEYEQFLNSIHIEYYNRFGSHYLSGNIWFTDGSWAERCEHNNYAQWEIYTTLVIPEVLK